MTRLDGEVLVVNAHFPVGEVGKAVPVVAVEVLAAVRLLDEPVLLAVRLCVAGQLGVVERHDPTDHAHAERVQLRGDIRGVVVRRGRAGRLGDRDRGRVVDDAVLVLDVELNGVDPLVLDHLQDRVAERGVGPGRAGHVHGTDVVRVGRRHCHQLRGRVAGGVGGHDLRAGWRGGVADRERRALLGERAAGGEQTRALVDGAGHGDAVFDRDGLGRYGQLQRWGGAVNGDGLASPVRSVREAVFNLDGDRVPAITQPGE